MIHRLPEVRQTFFSLKNQIKMVGNFLVTKKFYKSTIDIYAVLDLC